jgi:hypothetical protein
MSFGDIPSHYDKYKIMSFITYVLQYHGCRYLTTENLPKMYHSSVSVKFSRFCNRHRGRRNNML